VRAKSFYSYPQHPHVLPPLFPPPTLRVCPPSVRCSRILFRVSHERSICHKAHRDSHRQSITIFILSLRYSLTHTLTQFKSGFFISDPMNSSADPHVSSGLQVFSNNIIAIPVVTIGSAERSAFLRLNSSLHSTSDRTGSFQCQTTCLR
jgi:hypothetical protein